MNNSKIIDKILNSKEQLNVSFLGELDLVIIYLYKYTIFLKRYQKGGLITKSKGKYLNYYYCKWGDFKDENINKRFSKLPCKEQESHLKDVMMYEIFYPKEILKNILNKDWRKFKGIHANKDNIEILDLLKKRLIKSLEYYEVI